MGRMRPIYPGGAVVTAASGVSTATPIANATGFWVHGTTAFWITVNRSATVLNPINATNATPMAAAILYGPFEVMAGYDTHIHVGGNGAVSTVTITLV